MYSMVTMVNTAVCYIYIYTHTHTIYTMYIHSMCIYTIAVKIVELKSSHHKEKTIFFPIFFF